jgi:uncharacterized protein (UPF0248 family)
MDIPSEVYDAMESMIKTVVRKEQKRLYNKKYNEKYYPANRDKKLEYQKNYTKNNKEKIKETKKIHYQKTRDEYIPKHRIQCKVYNQTEKGKKCRRIRDWKRMGLICDNYDALYKKVYSTLNCEECNVLLTEDKKMTKTTRCMDHDHTTGLFRNVLCNSCNSKRG